MLFGLSSVAWSYAITGPARGAVLLIVVLVLLFGSFSLKPRQSRFVALAGFVMLGGVMVWKAWTDPQHYDPRVEGTHLLFAAIVTVAMAVLADRLGRLRGRLVAQRSELAQALQRIQALATRDELTGLLNRRAAMDSLRAELRRRDRARARRCASALIDLDHFKRINDTHGHGAGDQVLRRFADAAAQTAARPDVLARWGGEEFLLVMPATDEAEGEATLQRLRQRLAALSFDDVAPGLRVTFSAGVAACRAEDDLERTIDLADRAMYEAKRSGRDRVQCASTMRSAAAAQAPAVGAGLSPAGPALPRACATLHACHPGRGADAPPAGRAADHRRCQAHAAGAGWPGDGGPGRRRAGAAAAGRGRPRAAAAGAAVGAAGAGGRLAAVRAGAQRLLAPLRRPGTHTGADRGRQRGLCAGLWPGG